jgi:hypothetical protein
VDAGKGWKPLLFRMKGRMGLEDQVVEHLVGYDSTKGLEPVSEARELARLQMFLEEETTIGAPMALLLQRKTLASDCRTRQWSDRTLKEDPARKRCAMEISFQCGGATPSGT